ncbi:MAG: glutamate synthase [Isosphaeraceae bacterium]
MPDIRDYHQINAEVVQRLDAGHRHVRLAGAEGQRLLLARLTGSWNALVEVEGRAGPELAAELDAPGLTVVCRGNAADGAARGLRAGIVIVCGDVGAAVGYALRGGTVVVGGEAGPRAGLNQTGGNLMVLGRVGPLAGERQRGGRMFVVSTRLGPHAGHGRRNGRLVRLTSSTDLETGIEPRDAEAAANCLRHASPWLISP